MRARFCLSFITGSPPGGRCMRAREGGASICIQARGCFRYERPWLRDERRPSRSHSHPVAEATPPTAPMKTRKGVVRRVESEGTRMSPSWGGGFLPPPKQEPPRAAARWRLCEEQAAPRNLGARSHSGNSPEADAEGWIAFANGPATERRKQTRDHKYLH